MSPVAIAGLVILIAAVALFAIEGWAIRTGRPTISEGMQRLNARMDKQVLAGLAFLLGAVAGWFIAHFTSAPPS